VGPDLQAGRGVQIALGVIMRGVIASAALVVLVTLASPVSAASLSGDVISGSYDFPTDTTTNVGGFAYSTNPFVVSGSAAQTTLFIGNSVNYSAWDVFFSATSVTLTMVPAPNSDVFYSSDPFNGPVFTVLSGNAFGSVVDVIANNPDCVPCNPITAFVSGDSLFINWEARAVEWVIRSRSIFRSALQSRQPPPHSHSSPPALAA